MCQPAVVLVGLLNVEANEAVAAFVKAAHASFESTLATGDMRRWERLSGGSMVWWLVEHDREGIR